MARDAMLREGRPLNRYELVDILRGAGLELSMADPDKRVGKILWASEAFVNLPGRGYWVSDAKVPEGA